MAGRYESVDVEAADNLVRGKGFVVLDVRTPEEFGTGHAPDAVNIPFMVQTEEGRRHNPDFMNQVQQAFPDKAASICVTCGGGTRGTSAATAICEEGWSTVVCMPGGMKAWTARGLPTTADKSSAL